MQSRSMAPAARRRISPICMRGARSICRARAGLASTLPPACSRAKATFRWPARPIPQSAAPISGAVDECESEFGFEMAVTRIYESPRVTMPYSDEQWTRIESLGHED